MRTVLVTGVGGPAGAALARQLRSLAVIVVGTDIQPVSESVADIIEIVPPASDPGLVTALARIVRDYAVDVVIPTVSEELPTVSLTAGMLAPASVVIGSADAVGTAHDKLYTMHRLQRAGVAIPRFGVPSDFHDAHAAFEALGAQLVLKPRVSRGGRGVIILDSPDDVAWHTFGDDLIVQEFAPGVEYAPVVFVSPVNDEVLCSVIEKTQLRSGRHGNAEQIRVAHGERAADVAELARRAALAIGMTGPADIDIRRLADGTPVVLEINARFGANSEAAPQLLRRTLADFLSAHPLAGVPA